jgi:tetratricopeptide (TPR) repeat protein
MRVLRFALAVCLFFCVDLARADDQPDPSLCKVGIEGKMSADRIIDTCTALFQSDETSSKVLGAGHLIRGTAYDRKKDFDRALTDYSEAVRLMPTSPDALRARALVYAQKNDIDHAIADLDTEILLRPGLYAYLFRGNLHQDKGQYDAAIDDFSRALDLQPNSFDAYNGRCWTRALIGKDLQAALADCNSALGLNSAAAEAVDSRGLVYFRLGQFAQAISDYSAALSFNPKEASSLYIRGLAKLRLGKTEDGNTDVAAAKAIDPHVAERYARYGIAP